MPDTVPATFPVPAPHVPAELIDALAEARLPALDHAVLFRMLARIGQDGACYESARSMADALGMSDKRVRQAQQRFVDAGLFAAYRRTGESTAYEWTGRMRTGLRRARPLSAARLAAVN